MRRRLKSFVVLAVLFLLAITGGRWFLSDSGSDDWLAARSARAAGVKAATDWGTLKGRFVFKGTPPKAKTLPTNGKDGAVCDLHPILDESLLVDEKTHGIANVVVFARKTSRVHDMYQDSKSTEVDFDQKNCVFLSHVLPMQVGQTLNIKNSDPIGHNSNISPLGDAGINPLLSPGAEQKHVFKRQQNAPIAVTCNIHPWMKAYILPRNDPYFAATGPDGSFEIANLPAGEDIEFQVWHERGKGNQGGLAAKKEWSNGRFKVKLKAGETVDLGDINVAENALK